MDKSLPWLSCGTKPAQEADLPRPKARLGVPEPVKGSGKETGGNPGEDEAFELVVPQELSYLRQIAEEEGKSLGDRDFVLLSSSSLLGAMDKDERILRTTFVQEYLHDYDPVAAACRCGFSDERSGNPLLDRYSPAQRAARKLMAEPVVQRLIKEYNVVRAQEVDPVQIRALILREANNFGLTGSAAARQNSQKLLAEMANLSGKKAAEDDAKTRGGIMAIPARFPSDRDWQEVAMPSQQRLKESIGA